LLSRHIRSPDRTTDSTLTLAMVVQRVQIHDGQIAVQSAALPGVQSVAGLQAHLDGQVDTHGFRLQVHSLTARTTPADVVLYTLHGTIQGDTETIRIERLHLQTAQTLVTADGSLPGSRQPASLMLHMQPLDVAELGRLLQRQDLYGLLSLTLTAQGPADALTVYSSGLHVSVQHGRVQVQYCDLHTSVARLTATGLLDLAGSSALQYDLTADLASLGALLRTETLDGTLHLWGQASGALTAIN